MEERKPLDSQIKPIKNLPPSVDLSYLYLILLALAAVLISLIGAYFSISGLSKLFFGAKVSVMLMAGSLEFSKFIAAGFLHYEWKNLSRLLRVYLTLSVLALMLITSLGIFGYLTKAYQGSALELKTLALQIDRVETERQRTENELRRLDLMVSEIPANRTRRRAQLREELQPEQKRLKGLELSLSEEQVLNRQQKAMLEAELGPLVYVADRFKFEIDDVAAGLIFIFVLIFDPLALCLVFAVSTKLQLGLPKPQREHLSPTAPLSSTTTGPGNTLLSEAQKAPVVTPSLPDGGDSVKRKRGRPRKHPLKTV